MVCGAHISAETFNSDITILASQPFSSNILETSLDNIFNGSRRQKKVMKISENIADYDLAVGYGAWLKMKNKRL